MRKFHFTFFLFLINLQIQAQSISPSAFNNGGGYSSNLEWSIGESVSISNFLALDYNLSTGVLQPFTNLVTAINEYGPMIFGDQITIGPNPTVNILHLRVLFHQVGNMTAQLLDSKSTILNTIETGPLFSSYDKDFLMKDLPSGIFYLKIYFKPLEGGVKTGIYKVIKL